MIKAIIFDCFGVVIADALEVVCAQLRVDDPPAAVAVRDLVHASNRGMLSPEESSHQIAQICGLSYEAYRQKITEGEVKDRNLLAYILELRGHYKTAMLSNIGSEARLETRFDKGELAKHFDVVVASGDIGYAKPEAAAYEITAGRLGVRLEECVFIDDRLSYCDGAQAVGMPAIHYKGLAQLRAELEPLLATSQ